MNSTSSKQKRGKGKNRQQGQGKSQSPKKIKKGTQRSGTTLPKRPWRREEKALDDLPDRLLRANGGRGTDIRAPSTTHQETAVTDITARTSVSTIDQVVFMEDGALQGLSLGCIAMAVKKGWGLAGVQQVYNAYVYLYQTFLSACKGTFPTLVTAPRWLWEILAALRPKSSRFKTGSINYKWEVEVLPLVPPPELIMGAASVFFGFPTAAIVNGLLELTAPPPYTADEGERAITSLFQFFPDKGMYQRVSDPGESAFLHTDVSCFQAVYPEWGATALGPGGVAMSILGEVFDQCPILSKFALYQNVQWRGSQELKKSAGSSSYIPARLAEMEKVSEMRCKTSPIFKFYNFDQYFLTLSYILGLAMEQASTDQSVGGPVPTCPLSPWMVQLLLRQTLLPRFANERAMDLTQTGGDSEGLFPMVCMNNGVSITTETFPSMLLPFVFAENCRSAYRLLRDIKNPQYGTTTIDLVPLLCRPSKSSVPTLGNFTYNNATSGPQPIYTPAAPGEVDVDLLDLSFGSPVKTFLTANGEYLGVLVNGWNDWIKKLGNHLSSLVSVGTEPGIAALCTVINTVHVRRSFFDTSAPAPMPSIASPRPPPKELAGKRGSSDRPKERGFKLTKKILGVPAPDPATPSSAIYTIVVAQDITSSMPFLTPLLRYQRAFNQPQAFASSVFQREQTIAFQQVYQCEPHKMSYDDLGAIAPFFNASVTMDSLALGAASLDIKSNLAARSEAEIELSEMAEKGDGGFFTSLAGIIGDALGAPGVRKIANMVGSVIDI